MRRLKTVRRPPIYPKTPGHLPCSSLTHPLPLPSRRPSVSFGGFGLRRTFSLSFDTQCPKITPPLTGLLSIRIADHYLDLRLVKHARHVALGSSAAGSDAPLDPSTGYLDHAQAQDALVSQASFTLSSFSGRMNASTLFILSSSRAFTYCKDRSRTERQPQEARVFVPVETYTA